SGMEVEPFLESARHRDRVRAAYGFTEKHIVVGKIARLFELKGHEFVIAAAGDILSRVPEIRFLFVGDGTLQEKYKAEIARRGLSEYFLFAGLVPPTEIPAMLSAMDIVVHTSLREGLARVLPQALLAGKPVVSFDVDGAREVVVDGETGFLLPPKDGQALVASILTLAADPGMRERFGNAGQGRFAEQFDHRSMTARIREIYREILERKS
ncbi:MAG TPA: glycosyltransferase family 1 protein, partial [Planctomycetaceae bacterium]|nr:glycosyltransferase family 1 protein [Planctomycetaceae bacterium]